MKYGEKVRYAMKKAGKTSGEVAEYVGVSQPMISKVINSKSEFSPDNLKKFSEFVDVPIEFFINEQYVPLEEMELTDKLKEILADSKSADFIVLADKAKTADITPAELEEAINYLISIKKKAGSN